MTKEINLGFVKKKRMELHYTNADMAKALGLSSPEKYYRRETGEYAFKATELPALSAKLKEPIESFFK